MKPSRKERERDLLVNLRRDQILQAAENLFLARGMRETTITHIAQACEMARGALYNYFGSKDEIAFIIWTKISQGFLEELQSAVQGAKTGIEEFRAILQTYPRTKREHGDYHVLNAQFNAYFTRSYPEIPAVQAFFEANRAIANLVEGSLRRGIHDGSIRPTADPELTALTVLNLMNGLMEKLSLREELMNQEQSMPLARQFDHAIDLLIASLEVP